MLNVLHDSQVQIAVGSIEVTLWNDSKVTIVAPANLYDQIELTQDELKTLISTLKDMINE